MATSRLWIIIVRDRREVRKHIRGYLAELNDSELSDALTATSPPDALPYTGDSRGGWQRPVISAPIPALGGDRLCAWGIRESQMPASTQTALDVKEAQFPQFIRTFKQQQGETPAQMRNRVAQAVGWIERPSPIGALT